MKNKDWVNSIIEYNTIMSNIQNELKVPKGNVNKFGNYKYRSAEDILEAAKPILKTYNAFLRLSDEIVSIGNKVFLKASAIITVKDYTETVYGYAELSEHKGMSSEQATGTASSYARKYALNGLFLIDETEADADSQKPQLNKPTATKENIAKAKQGNFTIQQIKQHYTVTKEMEAYYESL